MDAVEFARTYEGSFDFMRSMRQKVERGETLSPNMLSAVQRCADAEANRPKPFIGPRLPLGPGDGLDLSVLPEGTSRYAVKNSEGTLSFLRVDRPNKKGSRWIGFAFVKHISGPNEERIGVQRPGSPYTGQMVGLLGKVLHNPWAAMARYGQEIGECGKCGRRLTDETSRTLGIGPECRKGKA